MANPIIKIKRSAVAGKIPTTASLELGELAINTYDGKVYIEQDQGGVGVGTTIIVVNPWSVGTGTDTYNTYFTAGNVGVGTTNPGSKLTVNGAVQIQQDSGSNNRLIFRGHPGSSYRWNIDNYSSSNEFRIFREDDATAANGFAPFSISTTGTLTANKFSGDGSLLTNLPSSGGSSQWVTTSVGIHTLSNVGIGTTNPTSKLTVSGDVSITGIFTADQVYTSNNGNGQNIRIGDDFWLGDVNVADTTRFSGAQDSTRAFVIFGSSDAVALGRTGTGPLYYGGNFNVAGVITASSFSGNASSATYATSSGIATYATTAGVSTSVIGGIASVTSLSVSGVSTFAGISTHTASIFGTQANFSGIVTATEFDISGGTNTLNAGGISVGVGTITTLNVTNLTPTRLNISGISTITTLVGTNINYSGVGTITTLNVTNLTPTRLNISGISTITTLVGTNINYSGVGTITTLNVTNLTPTRLNISGISTITTLVGTNINYSGVGTITTLNVTNLTPTNINSSGISTLGTVTISSGIITATSGVVTYYGDGSKLTGVTASGIATVAISTSAPTSPNVGDMWYNSTLGRTFIYYNDGDSSQWVDSAPFNIPTSPTLTPGRTDTNFTATAGQTSFTVSYTVGYIDVYLNGVRLTGTEYVATNGSTVVLAEAAAAGDVISIVELRTGIGATGAQASASLTIGTRAGAYTQNAVGAGITIALRSGVGTASF